MTLNFELATRYLFATHPLVMIIICHIIYKSQLRRPSYGHTEIGFTETYAQSLSADCDIDL